MAKVTGLGGVFFTSPDPEALRAWYAEHLGLPTDQYGAVLEWKNDPSPGARSVWSPFPLSTRYFDPSTRPFMVNFRVDDVHALVASLRAAGQPVDAKVEESEFGKFGWVMDPDGTRIELWEPPPGQ